MRWYPALLVLLLPLPAQAGLLAFDGFENRGGEVQISGLSGPIERCGSGTMEVVPTGSVAGVGGSGDWVAVYRPGPIVYPEAPGRCGLFAVLGPPGEEGVALDADALYRISWDGVGVIGFWSSNDDLGGGEIPLGANELILLAASLDTECGEFPRCAFGFLHFWLSAEVVEVAWIDNLRLDRLSAVPEPGALALLLTGLGGLLAVRRRS